MTQNLNVFVQGRRVAVLSTRDGFEHHLTYDRDVQPADFVSLLMPVQSPSYSWPTLHPFFQVNLPEGFLLAALKQQLGPHLGARPLDLLAVVGHNMVGRVQVSAGQAVSLQAAQIELGPLLHGQSSQQRFAELLLQFSASGVSGVVPKFLTPSANVSAEKRTLPTKRHIIKSGSGKLAFMALNEYFSMQVAQKTGFATARTAVSDDGQVLAVERFDIDSETGARLGFEDCCSLLGLSADDKYDSTWERIARLSRQWIAPVQQREALEHLAVTALLSYALGNADCHTKNLGFLYSTSEQIRVAPIYDLLTIRAFEDYAHNPPAMHLGGRKVWEPGKVLWQVLQQHFLIDPRRQRELAQIVCDATASVFSELLYRTRHTQGFEMIGSRMIWEWEAGLRRLADRTRAPLRSFAQQAKAVGLSEPAPVATPAPEKIGRSALLAARS
jgi:serine/threonine-protein kinase HipA